GGGSSEAPAPSDPFFPALTRPVPLAATPVGSDFIAPPLGPIGSDAIRQPAVVDAAALLTPVSQPAVVASSTLASVKVLPPSPPSLVPDFARQPLSFEPNLGQGSPGTSFLAHGAGYGIALAPEGISLALSPPAAVASPTPPEVVQVHFAGASPEAGMVGREELPGRANYFNVGDHPLTLTDVPTYAAVEQDLGSGLSVVYHGNGPNLQFDFHLAAGGDPSAVAISYTGIRGATLDGQGQLVLQTASGRDLVQQAPL